MIKNDNGIISWTLYNKKIKGYTTPLTGVAIARYVFGLVAVTMMEKKDDQIGMVYQSFNRFEHYPHGERKKDDIPDLSNNIRFSYSIFGTTY